MYYFLIGFVSLVVGLFLGWATAKPFLRSLEGLGRCILLIRQCDAEIARDLLAKAKEERSAAALRIIATNEEQAQKGSEL